VKRINFKRSISCGELLYGIQPVYSALLHKKRHFSELFISRGKKKSERIREIRKLADEISININEVPGQKLNEMCPNVVHQGVVIRCSILPFSPISDLPKIIEDKLPLIVVLDQIEDPHNLGAVLRTCGFFDVRAVVLSKYNSCGLTPVVSKTSSGVAEWLTVISTTNLTRFIQKKKSEGYWIIGLAEESNQSFSKLERYNPLILVLGNEGRGIRPLIRKQCDWLVSITGNSKVSSLNVSSAAAIAINHFYIP
tara:strand:+ start:2087 stop:2845 length:759 start_codon:yes stop_codon:yes gene_type:complete